MKFWICTKCTYKNSTKSACSMCRTRRVTEKSPVLSDSRKKASVDTNTSDLAISRASKRFQMSKVPRSKKCKNGVTSRADIRSSPKKTRVVDDLMPSSLNLNPGHSDDKENESDILNITLEDILSQDKEQGVIENRETAREEFEEGSAGSSPHNLNGQSLAKSKATESPNALATRRVEGTQKGIYEPKSPESLSRDSSADEIDGCSSNMLQFSFVQRKETPPDTMRPATLASQARTILPQLSSSSQFPPWDGPDFLTGQGAIVDIPESAVIAAATKFDLPLPKRYANADYLTQKALERSATKAMSQKSNSTISYTELHFKDPKSPERVVPNEETDEKILAEKTTTQKHLGFLAHESPIDTMTLQSEPDKSGASPQEIYPLPIAGHDDGRSPSIFTSECLVDENDLDTQGTDTDSTEEAQVTADKGDFRYTSPRCVSKDEFLENIGEPHIRTANGTIIDIDEKAVIAAANKYELPLPAKYSSQEYLDKCESDRKLSQEKAHEEGQLAVIPVSAYVYRPPKMSFRSTPAPRLGQSVLEELSTSSYEQRDTKSGYSEKFELPELTKYDLPEPRPVSDSLLSHPQYLSGAIPIAEQRAQVDKDKDTSSIPVAHSVLETDFDFSFHTAGGRALPLSKQAIQRAALKYDLPTPQSWKHTGYLPRETSRRMGPKNHAGLSFTTPWVNGDSSTDTVVPRSLLKTKSEPQ